MNETRLGELEEIVLLIVGILGKEAYALNAADEFESQTGQSISVGAVHSTLTRMEEKGYLTSEMGDSTAERGGRRKRIYTITAYGRKVLQSSRKLKTSLWEQYPGFATAKFSLG
jgi:PadR family transcriptional regulator PadR